MLLRELVVQLIQVAAKAANLARTVRAEETLFELLVQEKKGNQSNKRFVQDFKTLADVLVQETVRHDLSAKFECLADHIKGEESNKFTNTLGETVSVEVKETELDTAVLLSKVLDGNDRASKILARTVHEDVHIPLSDDIQLNSLGMATVPDDSVGIWIDPIDGTGQYIEAADGHVLGRGIHSEGLRCVTVLIGVYDLQSGCPLVGCINQPFVSQDVHANKWVGRYVWGVSYNGLNVVSVSHPLPDIVPDYGNSTKISHFEYN